MSLDTKAITAFLGVTEDIKTIDDFKKAFESKFVNVDNITERDDLLEPIISAKIGNTRGVIETSLRKLIKAEGVDFAPEELKGKKIEEIAPIFLSKIKSKYEGTIAELETLKGKGNEEVEKAWKEKVASVEKTLNDTKGLLEETTTKYEGLQTETSNKIKQFQIGYAQKDEFSKLNLRTDVKPVEKAGFESILGTKYTLDFDDKDGLIARTKDGKRISDPNKAGSFKTFSQILQEEADALGLLPKNPHAKNQNQMTNMFSQNIQPPVQTFLTNGKPVAQRRVSSKVKV